MSLWLTIDEIPFVWPRFADEFTECEIEANHMSSIGIPIDFLRPGWLFAILIAPVIWLCFVRSLAPLSRSTKTLLCASRIIAFCCVVVAAATPHYLKQSTAVFPVFVIDDSDSIDDAATAIADHFLASATLDSAPETYATLKLSETNSGIHQTNLQLAVQQGAALVPEGLVSHIVLLTEGLQTQGNLASIASAHTISIVPLPASNRPEIQVSDVVAKGQVDVAETFSIEVEVTSNVDAIIHVDLFADEFRVESKRTAIKPGSNRIVFTHALDETSVLTARLVLPQKQSDQVITPVPSNNIDTNFENNFVSKIVTVAGPTRVLLIDRNVNGLRDLKFALQQQQLDVEIVPPAGWPRNIAVLQKYDTVVLSDVRATEVSQDQMELLKTWVRDFGGGLVMLGGENSFGLGDYHGTAIADILPVTCDFQQKEEEPDLAMIMVIDKSDSMTGQKIASARQAASAAVELLTDRDQAGVIAFDGSAFWVSDLVSVSQKAQITDRIARIQPGGGTSLYPALQQAFERLRTASAKLKHVLVLTDGHSVPGDFEGIVQEMSAAKITVSTIGLGAADNDLLQKLAAVGRGRHYESTNASELPQIFAKETMRINQPAVKEEAILVQQVRTLPAVSDIDFETAPFLLGYVVTSARPTSEVVLLEPDSQDPILCWWKYGLGTSVAFTSDAKNRWAAEWLQWEDYSQFWAQLIRFSRPVVSKETVVLDIQQANRKLTITIDEVDEFRRSGHPASYGVFIVGPDQKTTEIVVAPVAAGMYSATFEAPQSGVYTVRVQEQTQSASVLNSVSRSVTVGYDDELKLLPAKTELLKSVADSSGGQFSIAPADVFQSIPGKTATSSVPLAATFLFAAIVISVADLIIRRIALNTTS